VEKIGVNGSKLYNSLKKSLQNINACQFYDAVSCFGRGIGEKRLQSLFDKYKTLSLDYEQVINVDGFGKNIAKQFIDNQDKYLFWKQYIENNDLYSFAEIKSPDSSSLSNLNVLFTGIRDKEMENFIKNNGGNICSSFNKDVNLLITKDIEGNSSKLKKAKENNVKILNYNEAMEFLKNMVKTTSD
jgi:NAD-dependent DNA ligase